MANLKEAPLRLLYSGFRQFPGAAESCLKASLCDSVMRQMEKTKRYKQLFSAFVAITLVVMLFIGVYYALQNQPRNLYPEEIRDYQGEDLSSIADFRENSIKGPQHVNASTYRLQITGLSKPYHRVHLR